MHVRVANRYLHIRDWLDLARAGLKTLDVAGTCLAVCCFTYGLPSATLNLTDSADFAEVEGLDWL